MVLTEAALRTIRGPGCQVLRVVPCVVKLGRHLDLALVMGSCSVEVAFVNGCDIVHRTDRGSYLVAACLEADREGKANAWVDSRLGRGIACHGPLVTWNFEARHTVNLVKAPLCHLCCNREIWSVVGVRCSAVLPSLYFVEAWRSPSLFWSVRHLPDMFDSTYASFYHALPAPVQYPTLVDMIRSRGTGRSHRLA